MRRWQQRGGGISEAVAAARRWQQRGGGSSETVAAARWWQQRGGGSSMVGGPVISVSKCV